MNQSMVIVEGEKMSTAILVPESERNVMYGGNPYEDDLEYVALDSMNGSGGPEAEPVARKLAN